MTDSNWKRVFELYEAASALAPADAEIFLRSVSDDPNIVREVRALLTGLDAAESAPAAETDLSQSPTSSPSPVATGDRIGRYAVGALIGRGATAEVYAARDTVLNRPVALKFLRVAPAVLPSLLRRFLREAQAASALNHPNIVTVFEILESEQTPVLVMELVEGESLRRQCGKPLPEPQVAHIVHQIALALAAAHARGLVHRDLKPENIMIRPDGFLKVLDFGLVKHLTPDGSPADLTSMAGLPVGTLRYMSPEQCNGEQATAASDIFALGIIIYEMLTGLHPFARGNDGSGALDIAHAIATEAPKPLPPIVSPAISELVTRALAKDPAARPSAADIADQFRARQPAGINDKPQPPSRRKLMLTATGVSLVSATAAGLYYLNSSKRPGPGSAPRVLVGEGVAADPAFSPDGSTIAFSWTPPGATDSHIYLIPAEGGSPTQLTESASSEREPCWSPDGSKIAFVRQGAGESAFYYIPARGGPERRIATNPVPQVVGFLSWLSNGSLVMQEHRNDGSLLIRHDLETGSRQPLTTPRLHAHTGIPHCSPDLKWIAYLCTTTDTTMDLYLLPADATQATEPKRLTDDEFAKREFCWTPDSSGLVYRSGDSYFHIAVQGGSPRKIPALQSFNGAFSLRRAASRPEAWDAAIIRNQRADSIWRAALSSSSSSTEAAAPPAIARYVSAGAGAVDVDPALSPDGRRLAFLSIRSNHVEIWLTDSFGGDPIQLTSMKGPELYAPAWSPNGKYIVSAARFDGYNNIFRVPTAAPGTPHEVLHRSVAPLSHPGYSPDGRWITFAAPGDSTDQLYRIPADGQGQPERLTEGAGGQVHQYSPDGEWIYYSRRRTPGLWRMKAGGGPEELVLNNIIPILNRAWKVLRDGTIYFATMEPGATRVEVRRFHPRTRKQERVFTAANPFPRWHDAICVSPDEQWILFPQREAVGAPLLLAENIAI